MKTVYRAEFNGHNITSVKYESVSRAIREGMEKLLKDGKYATLVCIDNLTMRCIRREEINGVVLDVAEKHNVNLCEMVQNVCTVLNAENKEPLQKQFDFSRINCVGIEGFHMELVQMILINHCVVGFRENPTVSSINLCDSESKDVFTVKKYLEPEEFSELTEGQRKYLESGIQNLLKDVLPGREFNVSVREDTQEFRAVFGDANIGKVV